MKITQSHAHFWLAKKMPAFMRDMKKPPVANIDSCVNDNGGIVLRINNTVALLHLVRKNISRGIHKEHTSIIGYLRYLAYEAQGGGSERHRIWARRFLRHAGAL